MLSHNPWVRKEEILAALWPDTATAKADTLFWATTYRLRRALYQDCLVRRDNLYAVNPKGDFWLDAQEFEITLRGLLQGPDLGTETPEDIAELERAIQLYDGPFLPDCYADWAGEVRDRLLDQFLAGSTAVAVWGRNRSTAASRRANPSPSGSVAAYRTNGTASRASGTSISSEPGSASSWSSLEIEAVMPSSPLCQPRAAV